MKGRKMDQRLQGKTAIVTGAGQTPGDTIGNGRAMAVLFARAGAKVMLVDRRLDSAEETKALIEKEGGTAFAFAADVTKIDDCRRMAEKCVETYGRIDILVNNVGIGGEDFGPVKLKEEIWDRIYNTNVKSAFMTCKYVLPVMEQQGSGSILNISSVAAVANTSMLAYKTSKAATECPDPLRSHEVCQKRNPGQCHHARPDENPHGHRRDFSQSGNQ